MHAAGMFGSRYMLFIPPYLQSNILFSSQAVMSVVAGALMIGTFLARAGGPVTTRSECFFNHHGNFSTALKTKFSARRVSGLHFSPCLHGKILWNSPLFLKTFVCRLTTF
jgi:hypothetical protein